MNESSAQQQALAHAVRDNRGRMVGFVKRKLAGLQGQDPEDVVSDVVLTLLERADLLAEVENLTAYLFSALANRVTDLFRKKPMREITEEDLPDSSSLGEWQAPELREDLKMALGLLSAAEQAVWLAVELEGWTFRELSDVWNIPIGTLLARKNRAGKALRKVLTD